MNAKYITEKEAAVRTGFSVSKLQKDRHYRRGLSYVKVGSAVRYDITDIDKFMEQHKIAPKYNH